MNCDNDFSIPYDRTYVKVKPFCESSEVHFKVYLDDGEVKIQMTKDQNGSLRWFESGKGESELAAELGKLIEEVEELGIKGSIS